MGIAIRAINMRKLAAIDIVFLGRKLILAEYAAGVFFSAALGIFVLFRGHSFWQIVLGIYLICLAANYVPMLLHALAISTRQNARVEIADELTEKRKAMAKYRRHSLLLLLPLFTPVLEVAQSLARSRKIEFPSK